MEDTGPIKRKPGGQPGNRNALKHGFYARQFRSQEAADLEAYLRGGLEDEVAMLRVCIRRLLEWTPEPGEQVSLETSISRLNALGSATARLSGLLKTQRILTGNTNEVEAALSAALDEVMKEIKLQL
jgi:hypothetical protein